MRRLLILLTFTGIGAAAWLLWRRYTESTAPGPIAGEPPRAQPAPVTETDQQAAAKTPAKKTTKKATAKKAAKKTSAKKTAKTEAADAKPTDEAPSPE